MYEARRIPAARASVGARRGDDSAGLEAAAADALRRAGGALPVDSLHAELEPRPGRREPLARSLRSRADLFLLVEPPAEPWREQAWTPAERAEYEAGAAPDDPAEHVVLVDGSAAGPGARAPAVLRETLLTLWGESPEDAQVRRELARALLTGD